MNSYNFEIFGSYYLLISLVLFLGIITYISYRRTIPPISNFTRNILITLRFLSLAIILFVIFNPTLNIKTAKDIEPKISYFIDNSKSMLSSKDSSIIKEKLNELINSESNIDLFKFDKESLKSDMDSIDFSGAYTDISSIFSRITSYKSSDNHIASVLISDGNYNEGRNPLIDLTYSEKPIYVIGVGDTSKVKDVIATNLLLNKFSYLNYSVPVEAYVETQDLDTGRIQAVLLENNNPIDTIEFNIVENQNNYSINFEYIPKTIGDKRISLKLNSNFKEINTKNNITSDYIKILDDKRELALFSSSPSSDLTFLNNYLKTKDNFKLSKFIQKNGSNFYKYPTVKDLKESQLIILQDFPDKSTPNELLNLIVDELKNGKPLLFMFGPNTDINKLAVLKDHLPFEIISHGKNEFQVQAYPTAESVGDAILNFSSSVENLWDNLPTVYKTETFIKPKSSAKQLLNLKINNNILNETFLLSSEVNNKKSITLMSYGHYRWKLLGYAKELALGNKPEIDFYNEFFDNIFKWLSVKEKEKQFIVNTNKRDYASGEEVLFISQLYDNSYNPLDDAEIKINLINDKNEKREIILTQLGNGKYKSNLSGLPAGTYSYSASAKFKDNILANETGIFNIGDIPIEYLKTNTNTALLKEIAEKTGGRYFHINEINSLDEILKKDLDFSTIPLFTSSDLSFKDNIWLLIIPIILLSIEWFIRKRKGLL